MREDRIARGGVWSLGGGLVAVSLWGLATVGTRALVADVAPLQVLLLRLGLASLVLLPWAVPVLRRLRRHSALRLAAAGVLGLVGYNLPVTIGLQWLPASTAGLLLATEPIWILILGYAFLAVRPSGRAWLGGAAALCGALLLAGPGAFAVAADPRTVLGVGLVLAGTLSFGAYTIVLRPLAETWGAMPATAASTVVGTIPYLAFIGTVSPVRLVHLPPSAWGALGFLALGSSVAGIFLWNWAVLGAGSARVGLLLYLEPVAAVVAAAALLGERLTATTIVGGLLILGGVAVGNRRRRMPAALLPDDH